jgi:hypothetical protein
MDPADGYEQRRGQRLGWLAFILVAGSVLLYLVLVGDHRHVFEVSTRTGTVRLVSNRSSFRVSLPGVRDVQALSHLGYDGFSRAGSRIVPMQVSGIGIIRTSQHIEIPEDQQVVEFSVNGREFRIEGGRVQAAGQVWELRPGRVVEIRVDRLTPNEE